MPLPTPTVHLPPDGVAFDAPLIVGPIQDQRPFIGDGDRAHLISREPFSCDRLAYAAPALSILHPERPGLYFCGDVDHRTDELGDVLTWTRLWASIPATRRVPAGSYAFTFPGLDAGSIGAEKTITAMSFGATSVLTVAAHGYTVGTSLFVKLSYSTPDSTVSTQFFAQATAVTTDTITIKRSFIGGGYTLISGTVALGTPSRGPRSMVSSAIEQYDYALPGITPGIATPEDFRALDAFRPVLLAGSVLSDTDSLTTATQPTAADYRALIGAGSQIIAESSVRRYLGAILERRTVFVVAL